MQRGRQKMLEYELQLSQLRDKVWIHASDGSTVGRFSRMGVDIHHTASEQMSGAPECALCTHGQASMADWILFKKEAFNRWGVVLDDTHFDLNLLKSASC